MKCVGCGLSEFLRKSIVSGHWIEHYDAETGEIFYTDTDPMKHGRIPKTMKCATCGKRAPNPDYKEGSE